MLRLMCFGSFFHLTQRPDCEWGGTLGRVLAKRIDDHGVSY